VIWTRLCHCVWGGKEGTSGDSHSRFLVETWNIYVMWYMVSGHRLLLFIYRFWISPSLEDGLTLTSLLRRVSLTARELDWYVCCYLAYSMHQQGSIFGDPSIATCWDSFNDRIQSCGLSWRKESTRSRCCALCIVSWTGILALLTVYRGEICTNTKVAHCCWLREKDEFEESHRQCNGVRWFFW